MPAPGRLAGSLGPGKDPGRHRAAADSGRSGSVTLFGWPASPSAGGRQRPVARLPVPDGGIVISTRSKTGTTWVQAICALTWRGQMRRLARRLGMSVPAPAWPALVQAATFDGMKASAEKSVPTARIFESDAAFFRRGTSGPRDPQRRGDRRYAGSTAAAPVVLAVPA